MLLLQSYGLAFLELVFILVSVMLLHSLKEVIGNIALLLTLGAILAFSQVVTASGLEIAAGGWQLGQELGTISGLSVRVGPSFFFTPFLAALLITYIVDGTLEAQRLIWGIMAVSGIFCYLAFLVEKQFQMEGFQSSFPAEDLAVLFNTSRWFMLASLLSLLIEFLALPVVYEILRGRRCSLGVSVLGAFLFSQVLDSFTFELVTNFPTEHWWDALRESYIARAASLLLVSGVTTLYLTLRDVERTHQESDRRPMDIVVAFLGAYGQAQRLQANIREWEGRYRLVVETTKDLILIVSRNGTILDANTMACSASGYPIRELLRRNLGDITTGIEDWDHVWGELFPDEGNGTNVVIDQCQLRTRSGELRYLEAAISPITLRGGTGALLVARDITRRILLEQEREALQGTLIHAQRMEAVGQLAAGIAHDFNNLLHAIQGSLDGLDRDVDDPGAVRQASRNIASATDRASRLTGQLLGFARAGKYEVHRIEVVDLVRETENLIRPTLGANVRLKVAIHPDPMTIEGDFTQLEQVFFNVLLNAKEAMPDEHAGRITFRAEPVSPVTPCWDPAAAPAGDRPHVVIRIRDNGCGIDAETREHIFEPFFTTKTAKGTGMGLAMAYGCIENHQGYIRLRSEPGQGTEFFIFLPLVQT